MFGSRRRPTIGVLTCNYDAILENVTREYTLEESKKAIFDKYLQEYSKKLGPFLAERELKELLAELQNQRPLRSQAYEIIYKRIRELELKKPPKFTGFSNAFSDLLLFRLVPLKHLERAYEPSKCDAEANRLERIDKDGNEAAANTEYRREINEVRLSTLLTLPRFLIGEIWGQVRRWVSVHSA